MGGRGARFGISNSGNPYNSQYRTVLKDGNIKFVEKREGATESLLETMTKGRVYVELNSKGRLGAIHYYDSENRRTKTIDLDHSHKARQPHVHGGYYHFEYLGGLSEKEKIMVDRVKRIWKDKYKNKG